MTPSENVWDLISEKLDKLDVIHDTVIRMESELKQTSELTQKHEQVIYGDPHDMGKSGILGTMSDFKRKIEGIGRSLDNVRGIFGGVWTLVTIAIAAFVSYLFSRIQKG